MANFSVRAGWSGVAWRRISTWMVLPGCRVVVALMGASSVAVAIPILPSGAKAPFLLKFYGTAKAVPLSKTIPVWLRGDARPTNSVEQHSEVAARLSLFLLRRHRDASAGADVPRSLQPAGVRYPVADDQQCEDDQRNVDECGESGMYIHNAQ